MAAEGGLLDRGWTPRRLQQPVGRWWCAGAWALATVVFVGWVALFGGPSTGDAAQSSVAVLAIARGEFHCAYPADEQTPTPPLYPMIAAAVVAAAHLDGPPAARQPVLGPHCKFGSRITAQVTGAGLRRVRWVGVLGWLALLAGFVAVLRAAGRGRSGWECLGVVALACVSPAVQCVATIFHPNDLLAMGLLLGALACALRERWGWAGVLVGSACMAHQFALLVAVPLTVLALAERRWRFVAGAVATAAVIGGAAVAITGGGVVRAIVGEGVAPVELTTWVDRLGLGNDGLAVVSRMVPLVIAAALAVVAVRRLGRSVWAPVVLCSLIGSCLGLRLFFEIYLRGYRFMAYVVILVVLDWVGGRLRWVTVAWVGAITLLWPVETRYNSVLLANHMLELQLLASLSFFVLVVPPFLRACRRGEVAGAGAGGGRTEIW